MSIEEKFSGFKLEDIKKIWAICKRKIWKRSNRRS